MTAGRQLDLLGMRHRRGDRYDRHGVALLRDPVEQLLINGLALGEVQFGLALLVPRRQLLVAVVIPRARQIEEARGGDHVGLTAAVIPQADKGLNLALGALLHEAADGVVVHRRLDPQLAQLAGNRLGGRARRTPRRERQREVGVDARFLEQGLRPRGIVSRRRLGGLAAGMPFVTHGDLQRFAGDRFRHQRLGQPPAVDGMHQCFPHPLVLEDADLRPVGGIHHEIDELDGAPHGNLQVRHLGEVLGLILGDLVDHVLLTGDQPGDLGLFVGDGLEFDAADFRR